MIGEWVQSLPVLALAFLVVFGPGLALGAGLRLRGLALWALAPVGSTASIAGLALAYGFVSLPWTVWTVLGGLAVLTALVWLAAVPLGRAQRRSPTPSWHRLLLAAGIMVGVLVVVVRFMIYVATPEAISQTNDAVFHLNALRYIIETGSASSLEVSGVIGGHGFYPSAWHDLASVVLLLSGADIPLVANMVTLILVAGVWPVGIAWFTRIAIGGSAAIPALAAALSGMWHVFPMLMIQWGVLYSYLIAVALLPAACAVVVAAGAWFLGDGPVSGTGRVAVLWGTLVAATAVALVCSQPSVLLVWGIVAVLWFTSWALIRFARIGARRRVLLVILILLAWAGFVVVWARLAGATSGSHWEPFRTNLQAVTDVLLGGYVLLPPAVGMSVLAIAGAVVAIRTRSRWWLVVAWLVFTALYLIAAAVTSPPVREQILGAWYADPYRFAALIPLTAVPLAGLGLATLATWLFTVVRGDDQAPQRAAVCSLVGVATAGIVWIVVMPITQMGKITEGTFDEESLYVTQEYLSDDERVLLERLPETVPEGATVIGNPSTGMGFGYMLSGRDIFPRTWAAPRTESWQVIQTDLRDISRNPEVCTALDDYDSARFVLDFGGGEDSPGRYQVPGMTNLAGQPGFELIDQVGNATLWQITACGT